MVNETPKWEIPFKIGMYHLPLTIRNELSSNAYRSKLVRGPGTGREKQMVHTFCLVILVGNFKLPFKTFCLFSIGNFPIGQNQNSLTIYIPTKISGIFLENGKHLQSTLRLMEVLRPSRMSLLYWW